MGALAVMAGVCEGDYQAPDRLEDGRKDLLGPEDEAVARAIGGDNADS